MACVSHVGEPLVCGALSVRLLRNPSKLLAGLLPDEFCEFKKDLPENCWLCNPTGAVSRPFLRKQLSPTRKTLKSMPMLSMFLFFYYFLSGLNGGMHMA